MALIVRIDVDRPYGRAPLLRHIASRVSSDFWWPRMPGLGYLRELERMLHWLNERGARAYVFFRRCTLPSDSVLALMNAGGHVVGLHLENSRTYETFREEKEQVERCVGSRVWAMSKHGSGRQKYGWTHYAPYEPEKYVDWAQQSSMKLFLGNLEDPTLEPVQDNGLRFYPSAFWLEPAWRDAARFPLDWLKEAAQRRDVVLLVHPENVLSDPALEEHFKGLVGSLPSRVFES